MTKINPKKAREEFRKWLIEYTGCALQIAEDSSHYPCGTCTIALFDSIGLNPKDKAYNDREKDNVDRANEVWRAILQIRDAKLD